MVNKVVGKAIDFLENLDDNASLGEKMEKVMAKMISTDPDVQFILGRLSQKFDFPGQLVVVAEVDDETLLVKDFVLATNNQEVISAPNAKLLVDKLTEIALTTDKDKLNQFSKALEIAHNAKS